MGMLKKHYNQGNLPGQGQPEELGKTREPFNVNLGRFANTGSSYHPGAATGGLLGLTVSQNARRGAIVPTDIIRLGAEVNPEVLEGREFMNENLSPSGAITAENKAALDALARERIQKSIEAIQGVETGLPIGADGGLSTLSDRDQQIIAEDALGEYSSIGLNSPTVREEIEKAAEEQDIMDAVGPQDMATIKSTEPVREFDPRLHIEYGEGDPRDKYQLQPPPEPIEPEPVRPGDPLVDPDANPYLGVLPDLPKEVDYSELEGSQEAYLKALQDRDYSKDKYAALTNFGLNLMSEQPLYEGEGFLSIAGRAGKEPLAQITKISEAERDAGLGFLKAKMDVEGIRANLKTKGEQTRFDNIIAKALAGAKLTAAEAAYIKAKYGDFKAISLVSGDFITGPTRLKSITDDLKGEHLGELTKVMNESGWKLDSGKPLTTSNVEQILAEITQGGKDTENSEAFISVITRAKEIYEGSEGRITQADSDRQAVREFLLAGGNLDEPGILSRILWGTSTAGAARRRP